MSTKCEVCDTPLAEHHYRLHPYVGPDQDPGSAITNEKKKPPPAAPGQVGISQMTGGDPVLRLALMNRGVISLADIIAAEQQIAAASASGRPAVAQADPPGRPEDSPAHT